MEKFVIVSDTTCDLPAEICQRFGLELFSAYLTVDGVENPVFTNWEKMNTTSARFYADLQQNPNGYTTAPASPDEMADNIDKYLANGQDVLMMALSSGISRTYGSMKMAADIAMQRHPNRKVIVVDSMRYSTLLGLMMVHASLQRQQGKTIEQTAAWLEENKRCFHQMGWHDDLTFLAKKGRISNVKAVMGRLINLKPLGAIDKTGLTSVIAKVTGERKAIEAIVAYTKRTIVNPQEQVIFVANTCRNTAAKKLRELLEAEIAPKEIVMSDIFPSCGASIGPGLLAVYYLGVPMTEDLSAEKSLINEVLGKKAK